MCSSSLPSIMMFMWTVRCVSFGSPYTVNSTNRDNTDIQKPAQSLMNDWLVQPPISTNICTNIHALKSHAYMLLSLCTPVPNCSKD